MDCIRNEEISRGLKDAGRVYLCGNLAKPNGVRHYQTSGYEIGISDYPDYTFEKAHIHTFNTEYNYVLEGSIKVFLLNVKKEYLLNKGDLFIIHENEPYVAKVQAGTRTIFSKVPGGDDKELVETEDALVRWGQSFEAEYAGKEEAE